MSHRVRRAMKKIFRSQSPKIQLIFHLFAALVTIGFMFFTLKHQPSPVVGPTNKPSISVVQLEKKYVAHCKDERCVMEASKIMTDVAGSAKAIEALQIYENTPRNFYVGDPHLWAHEAGSEAAKKYGLTGKEFIECPETFNYGCSHGFMEVVVQRSPSVNAAIQSVCGPVENSSKYSLKRKYYCYHGAGHGVLQTYNYDLTKSLSTCDSLPTYIGHAGCWQGVFMEGNVAADDGTAPAGIFADKTHPIAPCDRVAEKYQYQCFINLPGRIIEMEKADVPAAIADCMLATGDDNRKTCLQGLGIVIGGDRWQALHSIYKGDTLQGTAWKYCQLFPADYLDSCIFGALSEILNVDMFNITRSIGFCQLVYDEHKPWCFQTLGSLLRSQSSSETLVSKECSMVPAASRPDCTKGARL